MKKNLDVRSKARQSNVYLHEISYLCTIPNGYRFRLKIIFKSLFSISECAGCARILLSTNGNFSQRIIKNKELALYSDVHVSVLQEKLTKFGSERRVQMAYFEILNRLLDILSSNAERFFRC